MLFAILVKHTKEISNITTLCEKLEKQLSSLNNKPQSIAGDVAVVAGRGDEEGGSEGGVGETDARVRVPEQQQQQRNQQQGYDAGQQREEGGRRGGQWQQQRGEWERAGRTGQDDRDGGGAEQQRRQVVADGAGRTEWEQRRYQRRDGAGQLGQQGRRERTGSADMFLRRQREIRGPYAVIYNLPENDSLTSDAQHTPYTHLQEHHQEHHQGLHHH